MATDSKSLKFFLNNVHLPVRKITKPKMTMHRGRTWVHDSILLDGKPLRIWLDTTWGYNIYWEINQQWYTIRMGSELYRKDGKEWEIDPFAPTKPNLTTILSPSNTESNETKM